MIFEWHLHDVFWSLKSVMCEVEFDLSFHTTFEWNLPLMKFSYIFYGVFTLSRARTETGTETRTRTMGTIGLDPCPGSGIM